jgi:hypothetical protein
MRIPPTMADQMLRNKISFPSNPKVAGCSARSRIKTFYLYRKRES